MRFGTAPASAGAFLWVDIAGRALGADGIDGVGGIGERGPDECAGILLAQSEGDERQPQSEVRTLGVDSAENIGCVAGLQGPERVRTEKGNHGGDF